MGRSEGAVKSLYHRTLNALREEAKRLEKESSAARYIKDEEVG